MSKPYTYDAAERQRQLDMLRNMKDEDIDTTDPDAHVIREDQLVSARPFHETFRARKKSVTLHVDVDVLDWYQRQGENYQTRMNQALRLQMEAEQKTAPSPLNTK